MASFAQRLPFPFSNREGRQAASYALENIAYDVAIGGLPFLLAVNPDRPMSRELASIKKDQIDQQEIPGEHSIADWWLRSQTTFIGGAGLLYQDPDVSNQYAIQYGESTGLNPWTNGSLTLLRQAAATISDASSDPGFVLGYNDGDDRYWYGVGTTLSSRDETTTTDVTWGGSGTILSLASDGTDYFVADSTGIYSGTGDGNGSLAWNTGNSNVVIGWVKGRLMAGIGASVYELVGGSPPTLPTAKFSHLASGWRWTSIAEGTNAIYMSGYAGSQSDIYKFVLDTDGAVPTLDSGGIQTAQLPHGEIVLSLSSYLGTYVGIGTNRGFRVGEIDDNGDIVYGPLLIENADGVRDMVGYDRFFFVAASNGIDGDSGLYRVDLGQPLQADGPSPSIRYAYATDLQAHVSGVVDSVSMFGNSDRKVFSVRASGAFEEDSEALEPTGTFLTGRIRYNTLINKIYKFLTVRTPITFQGILTASIIDPSGGETTVLAITGGSGQVIENVILQTPVTTAEWLQLKLTFSRDPDDTDQGPEVNGWQFKALPGETRQRIFTLPMACFDFEMDRYGQTHGWEGRAIQRIEALENLIQRGDAVNYQDLRTQTSHLVIVDNDSYEFRQSSPPGNQAGWGGYVYLRLRTIADVVT